MSIRFGVGFFLLIVFYRVVIILVFDVRVEIREFVGSDFFSASITVMSFSCSVVRDWFILVVVRNDVVIIFVLVFRCRGAYV